MKLLVVFAVAIVTISADTDLEIWEQFKKTHKKTYKSLLEESIRFGIFKNNIRDINEHNNRYNNGDETYYKGINRFADWTSEEFRKLLTFKKHAHSANAEFIRDPNFIAPESVDWRDRGAVFEVKDQKDCGAGWAFSATGAIEGQNAINNNSHVSLSEQELIDCVIAGYPNGCEGGDMIFSFMYVIDNGIATEQDYPYMDFVIRCQSPFISRSAVKVIHFINVRKTEDILLEAVGTIGPISVSINADLLQFYSGGIFNNGNCSDDVNHGVLAIGYGTEGDKPYWLIKNSWGVSWGENGYFRLIRNANQQCGIGREGGYPVVE